MISLGLSSAEQKLFELSLISGYNLKITVQVLNLNHTYLADLSTRLIDGQVNYAWNQPINYSASMTLFDPDSAIGFDTNSPADNALYADRMIRIVYSVYSSLLPKWIDVPIFCGPVTKVTRDDALVAVECQGKESLVSEPTMAWRPKTYAKGTLLTALVKDVMANYNGESKFDLPGWTTRTTRAYSLLRESVVWDFVKAVAGSKQVYYDGRGVLKMRDYPAAPTFTFTEAHLLSVPKLDYNSQDIRNTVLVKGATPDGKPQIISARYLPAAHPFSPQSLARGGKPRYLVEVVDDSNIATLASANTIAQNTVNSLGSSNVGFDFDSFPIPHLEPGDLISLSTRDFAINLRATEFAIPLKAGPQSNGIIRKLASNKAKLRRK